MKNTKNIAVYLRIAVSFEKISQKYIEVLDDYIYSETVLVCLPWPVEMIPSIGRVVICTSLNPSFEKLKVINYEYFLYQEKIYLFVYMEQDKEREFVHENDFYDFTDDILLQFAELGFCIEPDGKTIKEILVENNLI
ncbi:MAG: hypothetical protein R3B60_00655 [Candidatus Paceibacterota bacterium]